MVSANGSCCRVFTVMHRRDRGVHVRRCTSRFFACGWHARCSSPALGVQPTESVHG
jgi:hypothetical protein